MEIIAVLAQERRIEHHIERMVKRSLTADLKDLAQMIYFILLNYDESKIIDLWERGEINFFIVAIIKNQMMSSTSSYYKEIVKFGARSETLAHRNWIDEG